MTLMPANMAQMLQGSKRSHVEAFSANSTDGESSSRKARRRTLDKKEYTAEVQRVIVKKKKATYEVGRVSTRKCAATDPEAELIHHLAASWSCLPTGGLQADQGKVPKHVS